MTQVADSKYHLMKAQFLEVHKLPAQSIVQEAVRRMASKVKGKAGKTVWYHQNQDEGKTRGNLQVQKMGSQSSVPIGLVFLIGLTSPLCHIILKVPSWRGRDFLTLVV